MDPRLITENVHWVGAIDWERRIFDNLVPIPEGTSYNAYLVRGANKTALIDSVDPARTDILLARLAGAKLEKLDYIVCQHAEQDHSGSLPRLLAEHPEAIILATAKCQSMLGDLLDISPERIQVVSDGDSVDLGGLTLRFIHFPWVHWPETMLTFLPERRALFTCDLFGSHFASGDPFVHDDPAVLLEAKRYYAEIMMPYRAMIEKHFTKATDCDPAFILPSHGPVWEKPALVLDAYRDWVFGPPRNLIIAPYISMHDSTRHMVEYFVEACASRGLRAEQFALAEADLGKLTTLLVDAATVVIGTPTVLSGPHPKAAYAAYLMNAIRPKVRHLSVIGSYGWGGKAVEQLVAMLSNLKFELIPPVLSRGLPKDADRAALSKLADTIAEKHRAMTAG
jgi:flavorubredoxin